MTFLATLAAVNAIGVGNAPADPSLLDKLLGNQVPPISGRGFISDPFMNALVGGFKNKLLDGEDPTPIKNKEPSTNEIFTPKTAEDGTVTIPVKVDKNSNDVLPWKTVEGKFSTTPVEARIVSGISVPATDSKKLLIASFNSQVGSMQSFYFKVTEGMKSLKFGAIGTEGSYYNLVEFDNNEPLIRQNPDKSTGITTISFPLEKYAGKYVALKLVDSKAESVVGVGEGNIGLEVSSTGVNVGASSTRSSAFYTFPNLFLGANRKPLNNYQALIDGGQKYAEYFGVKSVNSIKNFGMPQEDMYAVLVEVNKFVAKPQFDHSPENWRTLPHRLTDAALKVATNKAQSLGYEVIGTNTHADFEYMVKIVAIQEWFKTRFLYDQDIASGKVARIDFRDAMNSTLPRGVCGDLSWGIVYFATSVGLKNVFKIEGSDKNPNGTKYGFSHSWNAAILPSGSVVFADPTRNYFAIDNDFRSRNGLTFSPFSFSIEAWNQGFFLHYYHNQSIITGNVLTAGDVQPVYLTPNSKNFGTTSGVDYFTKQNWNNWFDLRTPESFDRACAYFFFSAKAK
jgi:hypothetical protein